MTTPMYCAVCNKNALAGENFCSQCGGKLTAGNSGNAATMTLSQRMQPAIMLFMSLILIVVVLQNFYLISSLKQLLGSVTIAGAPVDEGGNPVAATASDAVMPESDDAAMVFAALMTPCGKCNLPLMDNQCNHPHGAKETKALINKMFRDGKTKREVIAFFIGKYGNDILTPEAQAIYRQIHKGQKPGNS